MEKRSRALEPYLGSCQNYGPFWGTLNNRCRIILGTIILATTHIRDSSLHPDIRRTKAEQSKPDESEFPAALNPNLNP